VTWLLGRAAELAIRDGSEQIDADHIDRVSDHLRIVAA
jgi:Cdc6-like AAA superfamily ATPase